MEREMTRRRLEEYLRAESAILAGQSYTIGDRSLTRADLKAVQEKIEGLLTELNSVGRVSTKRVVFI